MNILPRFRFMTDSCMFSSRILLYFAPSIVLSIITSLPVPADEKQSHNMMPPSMLDRRGWCSLGDVQCSACTKRNALSLDYKVQSLSLLPTKPFSACPQYHKDAFSQTSYEILDAPLSVMVSFLLLVHGGQLCEGNVMTCSQCSENNC